MSILRTRAFGMLMTENNEYANVGGGSNWATATLGFIAADIAIPEPTDAVLPKWVGYGIAATAATAYLHYAGKGNSSYPGPWSYTYQHPSQSPLNNTPNPNDPRNYPELPGWLKWGAVGFGAYEVYDNYNSHIDNLPPLPATQIDKTYVAPYHYRP